MTVDCFGLGSISVKRMAIQKQSTRAGDRNLIGGGDMNIKSGQFGSGLPDANWRLNEGTGDRSFCQHIDFGEGFSDVPAVVLGITISKVRLRLLGWRLTRRTSPLGVATLRSELGLTPTSGPVGGSGLRIPPDAAQKRRVGLELSIMGSLQSSQISEDL